MSVQPTDFENAAFSVFVVLLARAIVKLVSKIIFFFVTGNLRFQLNLTIPMSLALENYNRCIARDGIFKLYHFKYVLNNKKVKL